MSLRDNFERSFPRATSAPPLVTALISGSDVQDVADHAANTWLSRPKWYRIPVYVDYGELERFSVGRVINVTYDHPGLSDGKSLLILGRSGGVRSNIVNLECWG